MNKVVLKISGEALKDGNNKVSNNKLDIILKTIKLLKSKNCLVAIVIGGGNFFRGRDHEDMNKVTADTIGMLGTVMNSLYLKDYLQNNNIKSIISTPFNFPDLLDNYSNEEINKYLNEDYVIIFGGGVGKSGFSTDSGVVLAKDIISANLIIKMTNVDGVYDKDPKNNPDAIMFSKLSYQDVINKDLKIMDKYAIQKCMQSKTKILVINFEKYNDVNLYFDNISVGTIIEE